MSGQSSSLKHQRLDRKTKETKMKGFLLKGTHRKKEEERGNERAEELRMAYTVAQTYAGFVGVDGVQDALVSDLALGGQAYEAPDVGVR